MEIESIALGRSGRFSGDGSIYLEVQRYAGNRPTVDRVVGVSPGGSLRLQRVSPNSSPRSGGGNGADKYHGMIDGLYEFRDILGTSSRRYHYFVQLKDEDVTEFDSDELDDVLTELFPGDIATARVHAQVQKQLKAQAQDVLAEIVEERRALAEPVVDGEFTANPEFGPIPTAEQVGADMQRPDFERTEYVMRAAVPVRFVITMPVFAKAATPDAAFAQARELATARAAQTEAARALAGEQGWPALTGTPRQVLWAETIRAKFAARDPQNRALKTASTAKYWIENHR